MKWKCLCWMVAAFVPVAAADILYTAYINADTGYLYRYDDNLNLIWQTSNQRGIHRFAVSPINGNIYAGYDGTDRWVKQFDRQTGALIGTTVPTISGLSSNHVNDVAFGHDWNQDGVPDLWIVTRTSLLVFNGAQTVGSGAATELARWTVADSSSTVYDGTGGSAILFGPDITGDGVAELYVGKGGNNSYGRINVYNIAASTVDNLVKAATYSAGNTRDIENLLFGPDVFGNDGHLDLVGVSARNYQLRCFNFLTGADMGVIEEGLNSRYYPVSLALMPNGSFLLGTRMKTELDPLWVSGAETSGGNLVRLDRVQGPAVAYTPTLLMLSPLGGTNDYRFVDVLYLEEKAAYAPVPAPGKRVPLDLAQISWTNPEPNEPSGVITCDVWFSANYPEYLPFPDPNLLKIPDPNDRTAWWLENRNFTNYAAKVVSNQPINSLNLASVTTLPLTYGQTYYWRVDTRDSSDPEAGTTVGPVWMFTAYNSAPQVDAGPTIYTYLTDGTVTVQMAPVVSDDGRPSPPGKLTFLWSLQSGTSEAVTINSPEVQDTTITVTAAGTYVFLLTVSDSELNNADTVTVVVSADACAAAKSIPGYVRRAGDINDDCQVNIADLQLLAADWLNSTALK
ncbi:MAG: hypothetical protein KBI46_00110 [Phycisphaerae bacterium]|nr:hypothetical protein [Phycisphaerae bacterium]